MTAGLIDLTQLAARSGASAPDVRRCVEAGLLPPARLGLRLKIRMPAEAADTLTVVVGSPTAAEPAG